ncbi:MAG: ABC transporter ATP-binding protein [Desulfurococcaceae archaeon]
MVRVLVDRVSKKYGSTYALRDVSMQADDGALVCILGPSGSGKSTLLRIIAGLIRPDKGRVYFDNNDVVDLPAWERNVGFVFQNVALFPHLTVYENIAFGLKLRKVPKDEVDRRVKEMLKLIKLEGYERRKPRELSGGEAQRVAIARALVINPSVLLFDEPLGHLDAKLREELKFEIRRIIKETGKTSLYVTHDQSEAFAIADYIYVINRGVIEQGGTPIELYESPKSPFVAEFIGSTNFLKGEVIEVNKASNIVKASVGGIEIRALARADLRTGESILIGVRPEDIRVSKHINEEDLRKEPLANILTGRLVRKLFVGPYLRLEVDIGVEEPIKADVYGDKRYEYLNMEPGDKVYVIFNKPIVFKR